MPYIPKEIVDKAKEMDLLTYLQNYEPWELKHVKGNVYQTVSHDSLKISNGKWMWWSEGIGGRSALDYLVKVRDIPFMDAVEMIMGNTSLVIGSFSCFANPTNVDVNSRIVCYNLSTLDAQLRHIGMDVVLNHIERRLIRNRKLGRATYIKLEEMDYHLTHGDSIFRMKEFFERARKYGGFITAIIQNATRVLQVPEAHTMLLNAEIVIMHKQEKDDARELARMYGLSSIQVKKLQTAEPGHGINKIGDVVYAFDCTIPEDNELYLLTNTDLVKGA